MYYYKTLSYSVAHYDTNENSRVIGEISEFGTQFATLSEFDTLTHMSVTQDDPTCHCNKGVKS